MTNLCRNLCIEKRVHKLFLATVYVCVYIGKKYMLGIGSGAGNYIDGSYNLSEILKLIYPLQKNKMHSPMCLCIV
jgi:hypothetical protein